VEVLQNLLHAAEDKVAGELVHSWSLTLPALCASIPPATSGPSVSALADQVAACHSRRRRGLNQIAARNLQRLFGRQRRFACN
jgi:hypothetical protein